jgi:hypothetical protein
VPGSDPDWRPVTPPPASARDDELLADPPRGEHHRGRLGGYGAGRAARLALLASLSILLVATTVVWYLWARPAPPRGRQFQLPPGTDIAARPRVLTWSQGKARLGLGREPPGVEAVELPDRTLRLADGSDLAQFKVVVEDGRTVTLEVVSGAIVEELKPGAAPLLPP